MDEATCPTRALKLYGKPATIEELVKKALEDKAFYDRTGGGVTISLAQDIHGKSLCNVMLAIELPNYPGKK